MEMIAVYNFFPNGKVMNCYAEDTETCNGLWDLFQKDEQPESDAV